MSGQLEKKQKQDKNDARKQRLAQALRDNLKKRKAQSRQKIAADNNKNGG